MRVANSTDVTQIVKKRTCEKSASSSEEGVDQEVEQEDHEQHPHGEVDLPPLPQGAGTDDIGDDTQGDALGYGTCKAHHEHGDQGGDADDGVMPFDLLDVVHHHDSHQDQCTGGACGGHGGEDTGEYQGEREE